MDFQLEILTLEQAIRKLENAKSSITALASELTRSNTELTSSSWKGKAGVQFSKNSAELNAGFTTYIGNLDTVYALLQKVLSRAKVLDTEARGFATLFGAGMGSEGELLSLSLSSSQDATNYCSKLSNDYSNYSDELNKLTTLESGLRYSQLSLASEIGNAVAESEDRQTKLKSLSQAIEAYTDGVKELEQEMETWKASITKPQSWDDFAAPFAAILQELGAAIMGALAGVASFGEMIAALLGFNFNCNEYGGDPVNMATGNFVYEKEFLVAKSVMPLSFKIFYNALEEEKHALGHGWVHNLEVRLFKEEERATIVFEEGSHEVFIKDSRYPKHFLHSQGLDCSLREEDDGYRYKSHEGLSYLFDKAGKLTKKIDLNENSLEFAYDEKEKLTTVTSNTDATLHFSYEGERLIEVRDGVERSIQLGYTDDALTSISDEEDAQYHFRYNSFKKLTEIINPEDITLLVNKYDEQHRVKEQHFANGGRLSYVYDDEENSVELTEQNGNVITYVHDDRLRSVETIYEDGTETYSYNNENQRTSYKDKRGNISRFRYDKKGNLSTVVNPLGERTSFKYGDFSKPTEITIAGIVIQRTSYDKKANPVAISDALSRTTKLEYNAKGQPVKIIQADLSEIEISYDERGNIARIDEPHSSQSYEYDAANNVIAVTDGNGNTTHFSYDARGNIKRVVNALGHERSYEYTKLGKVTRFVDFDGSTFVHEYNELGMPSRLCDKEGNETHFEYDIMGNVARKINALGYVTSYAYNRLNQLESVTNPKGARLSFEYDPCGNRTKIIGARGEVTSCSYDALNRIKEVIQPHGAKTIFEYNALGKVTKVIDPLGQESLTSYDEAGQTIGAKDPRGRELSYCYDSLGNIVSMTDSAMRTTSYEYFPGGLLKKIHYPDGRSIEYGYDNNKNLITQLFQDGYTFHYDYNALNQVTKISSSKGQTKSFEYDAVGRVKTVTDTYGNKTEYRYSLSGKVVSVVDALGNKSEYDYDKMGQLTEVRQLAQLDELKSMNEQSSQLRRTTYQRDEIGRVESVTDALGRTEAYTYDESGNLISKTDKEGYLTQFSYDANNQLKEIAYADGKSVLLSYNPLKQLTEVKDWLGITSIELDEAGLATKIRDHEGRELAFSYGSEGERLSTTYPDGKQVVFEYDEALRPRALIDGDTTIKYAYDESSRLSEKLFSNGITTSYTYDDGGNLVGLNHRDKDGVIDSFSYEYDNAGNKVGIEKYRRGLPEESGNYQYRYDALSRLTGVIKEGEEIKHYEYDEFSNRRVSLEGNLRTEYHYNELNQLLHLENDQVSRDFSYDARGNLTEIQENGSVAHSYEFGSLNRLSKSIDSLGQTALYDYNGLGARVAKEIQDAEGISRNIKYVLDLTKPYDNLLQLGDSAKQSAGFDDAHSRALELADNKNLAPEVDSFAQVQSFIWGEGVAFSSENGRENFYLHDDQGSPLRYIDGTGGFVESYAYGEFGEDLLGTQGLTQPFGYTGYRYDRVAESYYAEAREYLPSAGRFMSQDLIKGTPNNPLTFNDYIYCWNNPLVLVDKDGQFPTPGDIWNWGTQAATDFYNWSSQVVNDISDDISNFDFNNTSEQVVLDSKIFSWYRGKPVFRVAGLDNRSFSFGALFISPNPSGSTSEQHDLVKHEYGHTVQLDMLGPIPYTFFIAIPSMLSGDVPYQDYFGLPWEATADYFGGVTGRQTADELEFAKWYLSLTSGLSFFFPEPDSARIMRIPNIFKGIVCMFF